MDLEKIERLIEIFERSRLSEMELEEQGLRLHLQKSAGSGVPAETQAAVQIVPATGPATVPAQASPATDDLEDEGLITFDSPMVGTFYSAAAPGEPPFVQAGDSVEENQTLCIVEAMKLMNEVPARFPAVIEKVLVENGEPVEYGQPLFAVRPL